MPAWIRMIAPIVFALPFILIGTVIIVHAIRRVVVRRNYTAFRIQLPAPLKAAGVQAWLATVAGWAHPRFDLIPPHRHLIVEVSATSAGIEFAVICPQKAKQF